VIDKQIKGTRKKIQPSHLFFIFIYLNSPAGKYLQFPVSIKLISVAMFSLLIFLISVVSVFAQDHISMATRCNSQDWNLMNGIYHKFYDASMGIETDFIDAKINMTDAQTQFRDNIINLAGNILQLKADFDIKTVNDAAIQGISTSGLAMELSGCDVIPPIDDVLSTALNAILDPTPLSIADYVVLNSLQIINDWIGRYQIIALTKQRNTISVERQVLGAYYVYCGDNQGIENYLGITDPYSGCSYSSYLACVAIKYSQKNNWDIDSDHLMDALSMVLSGVNKASVALSNNITDGVLNGTINNKKYK
jgi:hypothetical protein